MDVAELVDRARERQPRAVAKLISLVEDASPKLREIAAALTPYTGHARVIGLTGPPGVGKSTSTSVLVTALRKAGQRVGVLAIDPSSPFSGGALLGDRIRMTEHATDPGVFIRSMATRGHLGGLAWATPQAVRVLDAAGFDVVLIETVGVGQSEVDVVGLADTTVVLLAPGLGDGVQAAKAGVLEIADVFVVNKADRDGADVVARDLKQLIAYGRREVRGESWRQPIVRTVASRGEGAEELVRALDEHREWLETRGELVRRRTRRAASEVEAIAVRRLRAELADLHGGGHLNGLAERVVERALDPYAAADALLAELKPGQ
ncbi:LAO/AO transport system kinase [Amycolatopsis bartoniae]|uniref:LAO/AO transport system kinase n=1 Tax=Amycolatopsis bartoniae TaxID=941986 RepID=A0A8H9MBS5_9PSEU|nr:methylmalonyl Co-A mutase-associated GTPase MeaB [Amycolatopsis bartoniae]MBB2934371.1 LAO/AO transport system kinase [Amycolatopsis bartoniae]TVS99949.1 methylmalonyl Co-A mutase-associated GTPase MeaB [Amycolatopsis bartoniae]GHF47832.1 LAO/AO transport system kinase [Amycolatopsis bartoniae]